MVLGVTDYGYDGYRWTRLQKDAIYKLTYPFHPSYLYISWVNFKSDIYLPPQLIKMF